MSFKKAGLVVLLIVSVVSLAYIIGVEGAQYYSKIKSKEKREIRKEQILKKSNLELGGQLPDYGFEDLAFKEVKLSTLISGNTIIFFISPDCHSCLEDIEHLQKTITDKDIWNHFIFISSGNPRKLIDLFNEDNRLQILYDHEGFYYQMVGIETYPTHVLIDDQMKIKNLIPGPLSDTDYKEFLN